jgi:uncharacterized protein (TIGR02246 family)
MLGVVLLAGCGVQRGEASGGEAMQGEAMEKSAPGVEVSAGLAEFRTRYLDAYRRADAEALAALYAEDALLLRPDMPPVRGRAAIRETVAKLFAAGAATLEVVPDPAATGASGGLAWTSGRLRATLTPPGRAPVTTEAHYLDVFRRQGDGSWLLQASSYNRPN